MRRPHVLMPALIALCREKRDVSLRSFLVGLFPTV